MVEINRFPNFLQRRSGEQRFDIRKKKQSAPAIQRAWRLQSMRVLTGTAFTETRDEGGTGLSHSRLIWRPISMILGPAARRSLRPFFSMTSRAAPR